MASRIYCAAFGCMNSSITHPEISFFRLPGNSERQNFEDSQPNIAVESYVSDLAFRVVAQSGIPSDRYHLGKLILQSFKDAPDFVLQVDGATNESLTFQEALNKSVRCAYAFRALGLKHGDVIILMAPNHIDLSIPYYAALYDGIVVSAVDRTFGVHELKDAFQINKPKLIFCQSDKVADTKQALLDLAFDCEVITFDREDNVRNFEDLMDKYGGDKSVNEFVPADFDTEQSIAVIIPTSGTTGLPKAAALTHKSFYYSSVVIWYRYRTFPTPTKLIMVTSPLQWLSANIMFISTPILKMTRLMAGLPTTKELAYHMINKYKPTFLYISPTLLTTLLKPEDRGKCDFTCFERLLISGSAVFKELIDSMKTVAPKAQVFIGYGTTEVGIGFIENIPPGSCGKPLPHLQVRLLDPVTGQDINESNVPGEMWIKGPSIFKEYYNNPDATAECFSKDKWFKTGDLFQRDQYGNYYFMERIKLMLKYKNNQISPVEIEKVLSQHPGVIDVAVVGIPHAEFGDLPVACVVKRKGCEVTAQEIKDFVRNSLSDSKQLHGGVLFLEELPLTSSTKLHRRKLKELVLTRNVE